MPCGGYVRRMAPDFKADPRLRHEDMYHWMDYLRVTEGVNILHARNHHGEVRIGPYFLDGYDPDTKTGYEFHGCYYHGCSTCGHDETVEGKARLQRTQEREKYLREKVSHLRVIWEHEFKSCAKTDVRLKTFIQSRLPPFYRQRPYGSVSESMLLDAVRSESLFGFLEVDIHVPDHLHDYFEEMSPLFCTTEVEFSDIGPFMQDYAREHAMSQKPRRLLVGGMKARQILLSTPYLKWLLEKGLVVTKIYQVIEYAPMQCFSKFVDQVSNARRAGDADPDQGIIADTMKLIGNSGYGSLIMDKEKHQTVSYVHDKGQARLKINDPLFRKCTVIGDDKLYEIELAKGKITFDLPIQLGYHILQLAKLRMLQFRFDFLETYCGASNFEYLEMDTDSAYMAIAGIHLEDIVHPSMRSTLHQQKMAQCHDRGFQASDGFFPRECCPKHIAFDKRKSKPREPQWWHCAQSLTF